MLKKLLQATLLAGLLSAGTGQAAEIGVTGTIDAVPELSALYIQAPHSPVSWIGASTGGVQILLGGDCFTDDAIRLAYHQRRLADQLWAWCQSCRLTDPYDGTAASYGGQPVQQAAGTDFHGTSGVLNLPAFS